MECNMVNTDNASIAITTMIQKMRLNRYFVERCYIFGGPFKLNDTPKLVHHSTNLGAADFLRLLTWSLLLLA